MYMKEVGVTDCLFKMNLLAVVIKNIKKSRTTFAVTTLGINNILFVIRAYLPQFAFAVSHNCANAAGS